jgi:hypothetical protein
MSKQTMFEQIVAQMPTKQLEDRIARSNTVVLAQLKTTLAPIMPKLQQIQQMAQQFAPQPPMDPAVKATYDVGMAEVNRKIELDKMELDLKKQEKLQLLPANEQAKQQVELLKNMRDNLQKHATELAKNQSDNQTNQWIASLKAGQEQLMNMIEQKLQQEEAQLDRDHDYNLSAFAQQGDMQQAQMGHDAALKQQLIQHAADSQQQDKQQEGQAELQQQQHDHDASMQQSEVAPEQQEKEAAEPAQSPTNDMSEQQFEELKAQNDKVMQQLQALTKLIAAPKMVIRDGKGKVVGVKHQSEDEQ